MPLDLESFPSRLFRRSQELAWRPDQIDYSVEASNWQECSADEQEFLLLLVDGFLVGERGVTHDLAPLLLALRGERGRMDEEMYLAAQLFEEARHVEFFERWVAAALPGVLGGDIPYPDLEGDLFSKRLPDIMHRLLTEPTPENQVRAVVIYHVYTEAIGAESAYPMYFDVLEPRGIFPALLEGIRLIRRDEVRHIAFGAYLLQRLIGERPELVAVFQESMEELRPFVAEGARQTFAPFTDREAPFGLRQERYDALYLRNYQAQLDKVLSGQPDREVLAS